MYYLKNTDTNGMGCLCSQEFQPTQPYKQEMVDGKFIATALGSLTKQASAYRPWRTQQHLRQAAYDNKRPSAYEMSDSRDYVTMPSDPRIGSLTTGGKSDSEAPTPAYSDIQQQLMTSLNSIGPGLRPLNSLKTPAQGYVPMSNYALNAPRHPFNQMTALQQVAPNRRAPLLQKALPVRTVNVARSPRKLPGGKIGIKYPKAFGVNEKRHAGYRKEHFDVAPIDFPSPVDFNEFQPVDYGNTIVGSDYASYAAPTAQTDPMAYNTAIRSFYNSLGYPNFNPQPIGYDFSGGSTPQISIDPLSYSQLPNGYRENFVPHPTGYGELTQW
jgi:hypothetical protein